MRASRLDLALLAIAVTLALVAFAMLDPANAIFAAAFAGLALHVVKTDLERFEISDFTVAALFLVGAAAVAFFAADPADAFLDALARVAVAVTVLAGVAIAYRAIRKVDGLGFGDIKLGAACAVWLSWPQMPAALLLGAIAGALLVTLHGLGRGERPTAQMALPFGAVLAPAAWLVWFADKSGLM